MQDYDLEQQDGREMNGEDSSSPSSPSGKDKSYFELAWFQFGLVIDNGGSEVSALND